jgi:hypothetical protein
MRTHVTAVSWLRAAPAAKAHSREHVNVVLAGGGFMN